MGQLPPEWLEKLHNFGYFGTLGAFAAAVGYLVQMARQESQNITLFLLGVTTIAGFYLGMVFGGLIPADWSNRDAIVLLIGASGLKGFELAAKAGRSAVTGFMKIWMQGPPKG